MRAPLAENESSKERAPINSNESWKTRELQIPNESNDKREPHPQNEPIRLREPHIASAQPTQAKRDFFFSEGPQPAPYFYKSQRKQNYMKIMKPVLISATSLMSVLIINESAVKADALPTCADTCGYAVVDSSGVVHGVIVCSEGCFGGRMPHDYMGCPAGCSLVLQAPRDEAGNVGGVHGPNVTYDPATNTFARTNPETGQVEWTHIGGQPFPVRQPDPEPVTPPETEVPAPEATAPVSSSSRTSSSSVSSTSATNMSTSARSSRSRRTRVSSSRPSSTRTETVRRGRRR